MSLSDIATGLAHIGIPTVDIRKSIEFYKGLEFEIILETFNESAKEKVAFLQFKNIIIETYETAKTKGKVGAIDHIAIDVNDIEAAYKEVKSKGYHVIDDKIQYLPFWENGVKFFTIKGPSKEKIEYIEKL